MGKKDIIQLTPNSSIKTTLLTLLLAHHSTNNLKAGKNMRPKRNKGKNEKYYIRNKWKGKKKREQGPSHLIYNRENIFNLHLHVRPHSLYFVKQGNSHLVGFLHKGRTGTHLE